LPNVSVRLTPVCRWTSLSAWRKGSLSDRDTVGTTTSVGFAVSATRKGNPTSKTKPAKRKRAMRRLRGKRREATRRRRDRGEAQTRSPHLGLPDGVITRPGDDLLSPAKDYHRPRTLNGRVRDGNGCDRPGMVTGNLMLCLNQAAASSG